MTRSSSIKNTLFSVEDVGRLCSASLLAGITPFVRVPYKCGPGHVQRILDSGAMGIVFPLIHSVGRSFVHWSVQPTLTVHVEEAREAVRCTKYPPRGNRSLTAALPQFSYQRTDAKELMQQLDMTGSTVFIQVETKECLANIDAIAAVGGVDVLLLGANDLSLELGILGEWHSPIFQDALRAVANAARREGKDFGIAGLYTRPDICRAAVKELGARFVVGHFDIGLLAMGMNKNMEHLRGIGS